jgi:hypothetical protein
MMGRGLAVAIVVFVCGVVGLVVEAAMFLSGGR